MPPTIRAADLSLVLAALKLRRHTRGATCLLAAVTPGPMIEVDCHAGRPPSADLLQLAARTQGRGSRVGPLQRGHVARVFDRTLLHHGRAEVQHTWHTGIRALRTEPRYLLHPGQPVRA